ncbi:hypothetical protein [Brevibacillus borstelensis]|uniref:hypothetical protein n=1 Tax=Brevibacillus borstelensis TaxID=45462 RepID=UPI0011382EE0|nr:hypothetical protein [Brevibacillus borstelensis]MCM3470185.1 hypothetical protein [Brevibacillus borstelensis]MCM3591251.1 hypothetical protein [Brevibacillus borstelensis]TGV18246.1 hypothetical protein EN829_046445 [Mesorhizobium sp. M00.F.Ca.ET.186.01.1.1]
MEKSLYFEIEKFSLDQIVERLEALPVEFQIEQYNDSIIVVFPDLPVRVYGAVRGIFGRDCLPYPNSQ